MSPMTSLRTAQGHLGDRWTEFLNWLTKTTDKTKQSLHSTLRTSRQYVDTFQDRMDQQNQNIQEAIVDMREDLEDYQEGLYKNYRSALSAGSNLYNDVVDNFRLNHMIARMGMPVFDNVCSMVGVTCEVCPRDDEGRRGSFINSVNNLD